MNTKTKINASIKIWVVIYPSITLFLYLFGEVIQALPLYIRTLLLTLTLVPWIVFIGLPFVNLIVEQFSQRIMKVVKS
jgi:antibiotic biosynthesis monooxygenase (ABM) superfamily enzyme